MEITPFHAEVYQDSERCRNLVAGHTEKGGRNEIRTQVCLSPTSVFFPPCGILVSERGNDPNSFVDINQLQAPKTDKGRDRKMRKTLGRLGIDVLK